MGEVKELTAVFAFDRFVLNIFSAEGTLFHVISLGRNPVSNFVVTILAVLSSTL